MGKKLRQGTAVRFVTTQDGVWKAGDKGTVVSFLLNEGDRKYLHQVRHEPTGESVPAYHDSEIIEDN